VVEVGMTPDAAFQLIRRADPAHAIAALDAVSLDIVNEYGQNLLHEAIASGQSRVSEELISRGVDVNHQDNEGRSPLHYAVIHHAAHVAKLILDSGGNLSIADSHGNTPLWAAVHQVDQNMVRLFMTHGADPNHKNNYGRSPLDFARQMNARALVDLLAGGNGSEVPGR